MLRTRGVLRTCAGFGPTASPLSSTRLPTVVDRPRDFGLRTWDFGRGTWGFVRTWGYLRCGTRNWPGGGVAPGSTLLLKQNDQRYANFQRLLCSLTMHEPSAGTQEYIIFIRADTLHWVFCSPDFWANGAGGRKRVTAYP